MTNNTNISTTFTIGGEVTVNRMGYGAMRITGKGIWGPPADKDESLQVLKKGVELGINFIDTADSYGPDVSEELIAEALYPYPADLVIATKGGFMRTGPDQWTINAHPSHLRKVLEGSLKRLRLSQIPLYQLHRIDPNVPFAETLAFLQQVQEEGLVKHIGLSEVSVDEIKKAQEFVKVVSVQNKYSVDNRKWESVLQYCQEQNMGFIPWNPLNAGNVKAIELLERIGKNYEASAHQVALSWLWHHAGNILLIPGTSQVTHLEENYQSAFIELSADDRQQLDNLASPF